MLKNYCDYVWREGKPFGINPLDDIANSSATTYRIVADPYYKRISIESYEGSHFKEVIYDSALFDFRHLKPAQQNAWSKEELERTPQKVVSLIRNQDDRALYIETCFFEGFLCRECQISSTHGVALSMHRMHYEALGDEFNGVIFYDNTRRPVMSKRYEIDPDTGEFGELLHEEWNPDKETINYKL